ncbi:archaea-specific SMC-related protein [Halosimplex amylolyticum]|uniref:archaea-specific SMC-related protein n=1 Tax=Halosimplex amylolyticum TaxID=3396616 RepID=UPI003F54A13E
MSSGQRIGEEVTLSVENIGGIDRSAVTFSPGVTILTGRNATNRTSLLQAIMAALGSDNATLKGDAEEGRAELTIGGETYTRSLTAQGNGVVETGDPYLDDSTLADLFAFLLESNECRQAVARGDDLREILMRPVDTDEIEREIDDLKSEKKQIDSEIENISNLTDRLPTLEENKTEVESEIEDVESDLEDKRTELDDADREVEETREKKEELESKLDDLNRSRDELQRVTDKIESERESIAGLEAEKEDLESDFEGLSPISDEKIGDIDAEIQRLRGEIDAMDRTVTELQSVIQFNAEFLEDEQPEVATAIGSDTGDGGAVTDELLADSETVTCWTCGSSVETDQIESTLDQLRSLREQNVQEQQSLEEEIDRLESEKRDLERERERYRSLQQEIADVQAEIEDRTERLGSLRERRDELEGEIDNLEDDVEALQGADYSEVLEISEEVNRLEFEIERLAEERSEIEAEIERIEAKRDERTELESRREEIQRELDRLRNQVDRLQEEAIEEFNDHMETVLELLEYDNLERIWIERTRERVREGRSKVEKERFDLHVVRSVDGGRVYEDTVDHLSESEREVTGLVFALAGYLVHEVYDEVPFMLLDSIEAIDADRITKVVDYLNGYADNLVVALLEDDAAALDDNYQRITSI